MGQFSFLLEAGECREKLQLGSLVNPRAAGY